MWILLWFVLSAFVMGVFGWSMSILQQQKRAWADFSKKNGLSYVRGNLTGPPAISGRLKGHQISFYTDTQQTNDVRGQRFVTVIEIVLGPGMPTGAAIATKEYRDFLTSLKMNEVHVPQVKDWSPDYIIKTRNSSILGRYLTDERARILHSLFSMKNSMVMFFFDELEGVLRIETGDPLRDTAHMEKISQRILTAADKLAPTEEEKNTFSRLKDQPAPPDANRSGDAG